MLYQLSHVRVSGRLGYQSPAETDNGMSTGTALERTSSTIAARAVSTTRGAGDLQATEPLREHHPGSHGRHNRAAEHQQRGERDVEMSLRPGHQSVPDEARNENHGDDREPIDTVNGTQISCEVSSTHGETTDGGDAEHPCDERR